METRFGYEFSGVRIHQNERAALAAADLHANAFTYGQDIVFASGRYAPSTSSGSELLAHELAHTVQQNAGARAAPTRGDEATLEANAAAAGRAAAHGSVVTVPFSGTGPWLARSKASPEYLSDEEIATQIAKYTAKTQSSSAAYPGRDGDVDWLAQLRAAQQQRAKAKPRAAPATPAHPTSEQERAAAVREAEQAAASIEVELLKSDAEEQEVQVTGMAIGGKAVTMAPPPKKKKKTNVNPQFLPGGYQTGYQDDDVYKEYKASKDRLDQELAPPRDPRPFSQRLAAAKRGAPGTTMPADFPQSVWSYGSSTGLFASYEQAAVFQTLNAPAYAKAGRELKHDEMMAEYQREQKFEQFHNQLDLMFIQGALMGRAPAPIGLAYSAYSGAETGRAVGHAIVSGSPTDMVGALLPVAGSVAFGGMIGGGEAGGPPGESTGLPAPEEVAPVQVRNQFEAQPDLVKHNLSGSFHQLVWEQVGGEGPAPLAFKVGRVIQVNDVRWAAEVGSIADINPPEAVVTPYDLPQPGATAATLPDPRAATVRGGPPPDPNAAVATGAVTGQGTAPPVAKPAPIQPAVPAGAVPAPARAPARPVLDADAVAAYRANPKAVYRSPSRDWHEQIYRLDGGRGQVPPAYRSGGTIIVEPDFPLP